MSNLSILFSVFVLDITVQLILRTLDTVMYEKQRILICMNGRMGIFVVLYLYIILI